MAMAFGFSITDLQKSDTMAIVSLVLLVVAFLIWLFSNQDFVRAALSNGFSKSVKVGSKEDARTMTRAIFNQKMGYPDQPQLLQSWTSRKAGCAWQSHALTLFTDRVEYYSNLPAGGCFSCCRRQVEKYTMALSDIDYVYSAKEGILGQLLILTIYFWGLIFVFRAFISNPDDWPDTPFWILFVGWVLAIILTFLNRKHVIYVGNKVGVGEGDAGMFAYLTEGIGSPFQLRFKMSTADPKAVCEKIMLQTHRAKMMAGTPVTPAIPPDADSAVAMKAAYGEDYEVYVANPISGTAAPVAAAGMPAQVPVGAAGYPAQGYPVAAGGPVAAQGYPVQ